MAVPRLIESVATATSHRDRDELDSALAQMLLDHLGADRVTVYRLLDDGRGKRVQRRISLQRDGSRQGPVEFVRLQELPGIDSYAHWKECVLLRDTAHFVTEDGSGLRSAFPLIGEFDVVGFLEIESGFALRPREVSLVAGVLRIVHNHLALLDYGERDTLTGLLNRKTFETSFDKLKARMLANPGGSGSWIGIADIDHFKSINDNFGHLFGDEVLLLTAQLMRKNFRGSDRMFRFGGEEFVVVLEGVPGEIAAKAFERFRAAIEAHKFPQVGAVSISIGFTEIKPIDAPASAVERADAALYYAKQNGRNQALCYEDLLADGRLARKEERAEVELF